jgi:uncharacterized protein (TIGR02246 family)
MPSAELLRELNRDIWEPFRAAYARMDADAYLALHSADLLRVEADEKWLGNLDDYAARVRPAFTQLAAASTLMDIDFRFTERIAAGDNASERGIYCLSVTPPGAEPHRHFAEFHTVARKHDGTWRIIHDHDHSDSGSAGNYAAAHALDDLAPFA